MLITEEQLFNYISCPLKYDLIYNKKLNIGEPKTLPRLLAPIEKFLFINILNGKVPHINELKKKWDNTCSDNEDYIDDRKCINGLGLIISLYNWVYANKIIILSCSSKYEITTSNNNSIVGSLGAVTSSNGTGYELLYSNFSDKLLTQFDIDSKIKYTLDSYAFEKLYNQKVNGLKIHFVKQDKDFFTTRNEDDYNRLEAIIDSVCNGIDNKVYYPRESYMCEKCQGRGACLMWNKKGV